MAERVEQPLENLRPTPPPISVPAPAARVSNRADPAVQKKNATHGIKCGVYRTAALRCGIQQPRPCNPSSRSLYHTLYSVTLSVFLDLLFFARQLAYYRAFSIRHSGSSFDSKSRGCRVGLLSHLFLDFLQLLQLLAANLHDVVPSRDEVCLACNWILAECSQEARTTREDWLTILRLKLYFKCLVRVE